MEKSKVIQLLKNNEKYLKERYFIEKLELYGSYAKDNQDDNSDIDLLYKTRSEAPMTLARLSSLENYLSDLLKINKVELVSRNSLNPIIALNIEDHVISVF